MHFKDYLSKLKGTNDLLDKVANLEHTEKLTSREKFEYPSHVSPAELKRGLTSGKFLKGSFRASRDNYLEGEVLADGQDQPIFIQGRNHLNRAVNEDLVAVEMLPQSEWSYPSSLVLEDRAQADDENTSKDDLKEASEARHKELARPSGRVVGIVKRNWRQYCGMLQQSTLRETNRHLFVPAERRIPKIRIETRQAEGSLWKAHCGSD
ncbi:hypothetical protein EB796_002097 [Bugula neritina]|uniref:CSD1 domain-containing protein n=1 Tax=Bugula neritina TaxID=10212 RepID=A0A7J7KN60_BUGNE|nr:hypothetical protein EB796_002097 [Bugula neritina]